MHRAEGGRLAAFDVFVCFRVASTALRQLAAGAELQAGGGTVRRGLRVAK